MSDKSLQKAVLDELGWEPSVDAAHVAVTAHDGVVTLGGHVETYAEKLAAERAASRVKGVRAIVEQIEVKLSASNLASDEGLAKRVAQTLDWDVTLPLNRIKVAVEKGWVTLSGDVDWNYQRTAAAEDVHRLGGVVGVTNLITVKPRVEAGRVRDKILGALKRSAEMDANQITIDAQGDKVVLGGNVHSWRERSLAEQAAWSAPGVSEVEDRIEIV